MEFSDILLDLKELVIIKRWTLPILFDKVDCVCAINVEKGPAVMPQEGSGIRARERGSGFWSAEACLREWKARNPGRPTPLGWGGTLLTPPAPLFAKEGVAEGRGSLG